MALNFPSSPNVNATYTFSDKTWTYNGNAWTLSYGTLSTSTVPEGSNLYFSNARVYSNVTQLGYITSSALSGYATNAQLSSYATTSNVALKANIADLTAANITGTTLNSSIVTSSLTSVGTLGSLTVTNNVTSGAILTTGNSTAANYQSTGNVNTGNLRVTTNSTLGTVVSGTWNGASIATAYTDAKVTAVNAGTGVSVDTTTGSVTVTNTGVTAVAATSPIATSAASGSITLTHSASGAAAATYGGAATVPVYTVNATGHITSASNVAIAIASGAVSGLATSATTDTTNATNISSGTLASGRLPTSGVAAATYGGSTAIPVLTVDTAGRITSASNVSVTSGTTITDDTTTNATRYLTLTASSSGSISTANVSTTKLFFNPSTGLLTSTDYNSSSDKRLKKNIQTVKNAVETISALRGVTFDWKEGSTKGVGLIAQEVEKVIPDVVTTDENGYKGVKYTNIIGILVEAIKEQQEQINNLKKQIEKL